MRPAAGVQSVYFAGVTVSTTVLLPGATENVSSSGKGIIFAGGLQFILSAGTVSAGTVISQTGLGATRLHSL